MSSSSDDPSFKLSARRLELLRALRREQGLASSREERIVRRPDAESHPLSFNQQRLWFLQRLQPGSAAYNLPLALRLQGPLDVPALERALGRLVERQDMLRTVFRQEPEGGASQRVLDATESQAIPLADLSGLPAEERGAEVRRLLREEAQRPFNLERGPIFRFSLLRQGAEDHAALVTLHHIAADALSLEVLVREVSALYAGAELPDLPVRFVDFAAWQRDWAAGGGLERQLDYWRERLAGAPTVLELPADRPRPEEGSFRVAMEPLALPAATGAGLVELARSEGATPFMALFALLAELLGRHTGQDDLLVGSSVANRDRPETAGLVGFFVNTLVLRADLAGGPSFRELLRRAKETALGAFAHQELPFDRLVEELQPERRAGHMPLFQVMLALQTAAPPSPELPGGLRISRLQTGFAEARIDLAFAAVQGEGWMQLTLEYNADLFEATTARRLLARLATLAAACVASPDRPVASLPMLPEAERHQMVAEWNDWGDAAEGEVPREALLHRLFEEQAAAGPERPALVWAAGDVSYGALDARANRLARHLRGLGVGPDAVVGVAMDRSPEMVAALLAVLKAGGAYLPLDPDAPAERTAFMLEDGGVRVALASGRAAAGLAALGVAAVVPEALDLSGLDGSALAGGAGPDHLAYVIYTSGSTGRPKGVMVSHRAIVGTLLWRRAAFRLTDADRVLQNISFTFDPSVWQIFGALVSGARLVPVPPGEHQDFAGLARTVAREGVSITDLAPPMLEAFLDQEGLEECRRFRLLFAGGQALPAALAARFQGRFPDAALHNIYGPTEAGIDAATWRCEPLPAGRTVPIGRPVAGRRLLVLDRRGAPVPIGVPGELHIGGAGLARGYLGQPALTAERFVPDPWAEEGPGSRLYRTGDLVRHWADGLLEFLGRLDRQVKVRGYRIELGEVEAAIARHPGVKECAVVARPDAAGQGRLIGYFAPVPGTELDAGDLRAALRAALPSYMVPAALVALPALPRAVSGKVDTQALPEPAETPAAGGAAGEAPRTELEREIAAIWREVLGIEAVGVEDNFFDRGGHSLLLIRVHARLQKLLGREIPVVDLFNHPTVAALSRHLAHREDTAPEEGDATVEAARERARAQVAGGAGREAVAIVGMAGRFPGAADVEAFWDNLREGRESIRTFSDEELRAAGVPAGLLARPDYVKARGALDGIDLFDAPFFDVTPREAEMTDPQHRLFLECAWHALEHAGYDPSRHPGAIGVYAGVSANLYAIRNVLASPETYQPGGTNQAMLGGDKDFLATRVSYKLNLRGPSFTVQTACSTSLVATHLACRALLGHECDMALAGGASATAQQVMGYLYAEGGINSPDGHCRAFDAEARGTVGGSGVGVVVLKRLSDALADGDTIHAVIRGTAINNDGAQKVGYTAPSPEGQAAAIAAAQEVAGVSPDEIGYVEAHGTGTPLGDPIEIAALTRVFRSETDRTGFCAIGSLKTNVGHLDAAAGVAGLIKTALVLERGEIPPSLHFREPNPRIDFASSPFFVVDRLRAWPAGDRPAGDRPRVAAVSSFGIGGTNAHAVLEEAPPPIATGPTRPRQLLVLSGRTEEALEAATDALARFLSERPETPLADAAYTLQVGRKALAHRRAVVARDARDAAEALAARDPERVLTRAVTAGSRSVAFLFPGQGAQHAGMAKGLHETEPAFRAAFDECAEILRPHLDGADLREAVFAADKGADRRLQQTALAQPALFAVEHALARLWISWGVRPDALIGHSLGEYVAACLAGVLSLEDALALVALRGRLMQALPAGAMMAVPLPEDEARGLLGPELSLAAVNAPGLCVASGPEEAIGALAARLAELGLEARRLHTSHAFHSAAMDPVLEPFRAAVSKVRLAAPRIPFLSNLTGTWIEDSQATDPGYWVEHLRRPVRFAAGVAELLRDPSRVLLEVGPGRTLGSLARRQAEPGRTLVQSLPAAGEAVADEEMLPGALGRLWLAGVEVDWPAYHAHARRRRVPLPLYPFERRRYWIDPPSAAAAPARRAAERIADPAGWFSAPVWTETVVMAAPNGASRVPEDERWLIVGDGCGLGEDLAARLERDGRSVASWEGLGTREECARRLRDLGAGGPLPSRIVHVGYLGFSDPEIAESGFHGLLALAQALGEAGEGSVPAGGIELTVLADGLCDVTGVEPLYPEKALLLGPVRVLPLEYPGVRARAVDVVLPPGSPWWEALVERLAAELVRPADEPLVALRGGRRWVQRFEPVRLEAADAGRLREGGVVLVTGGGGGIGLALAEHLARTRKARIALLGRTEPPRERLAGLEALGAEVLTLAADVADEGAMRAAVARTVERFGDLHAVIHAAGVPGGGLVQLKEPAEAAKVLRAKVRGTLVLEKALGGRPLDLFVLCSSLASLLGGVGQVDYCAANAFLDAFATGRGGPVVSIDWDRWREAGMAAGAADGLLTAEGADAFERAVASGLSRVVVSTRPLAGLIAAMRSPRQGEAAEAAPKPRREGHSRPDLATPYAEPRSETERLLAGIWEDVLGIRPVGIHDDFHELGGHSLLALQVLSRVRQALGSSLPLRAVFDAPTVARLAVRILEGETQAADGGTLEDLLSRLDELSDEEAAALLASDAALLDDVVGNPGGDR